jgi:hypothetical protein
MQIAGARVLEVAGLVERAEEIAEEMDKVFRGSNSA